MEVAIFASMFYNRAMYEMKKPREERFMSCPHPFTVVEPDCGTFYQGTLTEDTKIEELCDTISQCGKFDQVHAVYSIPEKLNPLTRIMVHSSAIHPKFEKNRNIWKTVFIDYWTHTNSTIYHGIYPVTMGLEITDFGEIHVDNQMSVWRRIDQRLPELILSIRQLVNQFDINRLQVGDFTTNPLKVALPTFMAKASIEEGAMMKPTGFVWNRFQYMSGTPGALTPHIISEAYPTIAVRTKDQYLYKAPHIAKTTKTYASLTPNETRDKKNESS